MLIYKHNVFTRLCACAWLHVLAHLRDTHYIYIYIHTHTHIHPHTSIGTKVMKSRQTYVVKRRHTYIEGDIHI
jgi:hypothetical protein